MNQLKQVIAISMLIVFCAHMAMLISIPYLIEGNRTVQRIHLKTSSRAIETLIISESEFEIGFDSNTNEFHWNHNVYDIKSICKIGHSIKLEALKDKTEKSLQDIAKKSTSKNNNKGIHLKLMSEMIQYSNEIQALSSLFSTSELKLYLPYELIYGQFYLNISSPPPDLC